MPTLRDLDGRKITVSLPLQGNRVHASGHATFLTDVGLGPALKVVIDDPSGGFTLLIKESEWQGTIRLAAGGEFVLELA
jgi:hypothetical protein